MSDTRPPDYEKYTQQVAREAQARNRADIASDREAIGESRGFEQMERSMGRTSRDPGIRDEREERAMRQADIRNRTRAGRGDWTRSVSLRRTGRK